MPGVAGQLLEELAELSERTGCVCRGGRRPTDLYSKLGVGQRMQHTVGDLCSGLLFVLCSCREVKAFQPDSSARRKGRLCCRMWIFGISEDKISLR